MKIAYKITTVFVMAFAIVSLTHAQPVRVNMNADVNVTTNANASNTPFDDRPLPPPQSKPTLKAEMQARIQSNKDTRNNLLEQKKEVRKELASTTQAIRVEARGEMRDMKGQMQLVRASTTEMFKQNKEARKEVAKKMEAKVFAARKSALVEQLTISITNLTTISTRIDARITEETTKGHDLTAAKALLVTANDKLAKAKTDVAAFQVLTASSTTEVELTRPRVLGDTAIKSVKDARDAYQKVVASIAQTLGLKIGPVSSTTPRVSSETSGTITN